jgi:hypothetical protein
LAKYRYDESITIQAQPILRGGRNTPEILILRQEWNCEIPSVAGAAAGHKEFQTDLKN